MTRDSFGHFGKLETVEFYTLPRSYLLLLDVSHAIAYTVESFSNLQTSKRNKNWFAQWLIVWEIGDKTSTGIRGRKRLLKDRFSKNQDSNANKKKGNIKNKLSIWSGILTEGRNYAHWPQASSKSKWNCTIIFTVPNI